MVSARSFSLWTLYMNMEQLCIAFKMQVLSIFIGEMWWKVTGHSPVQNKEVIFVGEKHFTQLPLLSLCAFSDQNHARTCMHVHAHGHVCAHMRTHTLLLESLSGMERRRLSEEERAKGPSRMNLKNFCSYTGPQGDVHSQITCFQITGGIFSHTDKHRYKEHLSAVHVAWSSIFLPLPELSLL